MKRTPSTNGVWCDLDGTAERLLKSSRERFPRGKPRWGARAFCSLGCFLWIAGVSSCCLTPPPAEKFFERDDPTSTLKGFVYAVDTHQWDFAYQSLTEASRKEIGPLKFEVAIRFLKDPILREVSIFDIISNALERRTKPQISGDRAEIKVIPKVRGANNKPVYYDATLSFLKEDGEWRLDFLESLRAFLRDEAPQEMTSR